MCVTMLSFSLVGALFFGISIYKTRSHLSRMELASDIYSAQLSLKSHAYQLFKQYADALIIGDLDRGEGEKALIAEIRRDLRRIRELSRRQAALSGAAPKADLGHVVQMETKLEQLITAFESVVARVRPGDTRANWLLLSKILDDDIDRDFLTFTRRVLKEGSCDSCKDARGGRTATAFVCDHCFAFRRRRRCPNRRDIIFGSPHGAKAARLVGGRRKPFWRR